MFGLNDTEIQNGYNTAMQAPFDPERDLSPGFFDGSMTAVGHGFKDASAKILQVAGSEPTQTERMAAPMTYVPRLMLSRAIQSTFGDSENFQQVIAENRPSPQTTGWLGQQLFALTSFIGRAVGGSVATGSPIGGAAVVGVTEGYDTKKGLEVEGVDEATATKAGVVTGVTSGLGALVPAAVPGKLLTRAGSGAAINVAMGGSQRGLTSKILEDGGYADMAEQYKIFDSAAITTDVILGAAFGSIAKGKAAEIRPRPSDVDAALASNSWHHLEVESAPGIPTDTATRNAHVAAMDDAMTQLAVNDRVSLDLGDDVAFTAKPDTVDPQAKGLVEAEYPPIREERPVAADVVPIPDEAQAILAKYDDADAFAEDTLTGKNDFMKVKTPEETARMDEIAKAEKTLDGAQKKLSEATKDFKDGDTPTAKQKQLMEARDRASNKVAELKRQPTKSLPERLGVNANRANNKKALVDLHRSANPGKKAAVDRVVERAPKLKVVDDEGKVTSAKDALDRANEAEAQAKKDVSMFEAAVQCFLEVGDA